MRYLWLAFLMGWSGSAYALTGTSPPVDIPITITGTVGGNETVCGGNPTVPGPAAAVGFTTLAGCWDWSQQTQTNNVFNGTTQLITWTDYTSWLACAGATAPQWGLGSAASNSLPCSSVSVAPDPVSGANALRIVVTPSDGTSNNLGYALTTVSNYFLNNGLCSSGACFAKFPSMNWFVEVTYRGDTANAGHLNGASMDVMAFWSWFLNGGQIEQDFAEYQQAGFPQSCGGGTCFDGAVDYTPQGQNFISSLNGFPSNALDGNYHTIGWLTNSSGPGGAAGTCYYFDGAGFPHAFTSNNCADLGASGADICTYDPPGTCNQESYLILEQSGNAAGPVSGDFNIIVKWVRVWSCAGWTTTPGVANDSTSNTCHVASPYLNVPGPANYTVTSAP